MGDELAELFLLFAQAPQQVVIRGVAVGAGGSACRCRSVRPA
jgi:hypothetical protein